MSEKNRINQHLLELPPNERLFRINAGTGWQGDKITRRGNIMLIENPRPLQAGPPGWPDCNGWHSLQITDHMVGQTIAVFLAEEHKRNKNDRLTTDQQRLRDLLESMGGIYRVIRP